jgi:hypothetical protein
MELSLRVLQFHTSRLKDLSRMVISKQTSALLLRCISYVFRMCPYYGDHLPVFAYFMAMLWIRIHLLFGLVMDYEVTVSRVARFPLGLEVGQPAPYRVVQSAGKTSLKEP